MEFYICVEIIFSRTTRDNIYVSLDMCRSRSFHSRGFSRCGEIETRSLLTSSRDTDRHGESSMTHVDDFHTNRPIGTSDETNSTKKHGGTSKLARTSYAMTISSSPFSLSRVFGLHS